MIYKGKKEAYPGIGKIEYEGKKSRNPLAFKWYNPDQVVSGKKMKDHLRFAVAFWHSFCGDGTDQFGNATHMYPWKDLPSDDKIRRRLDAAFEFITKIGAPFYCFHDVDVVGGEGTVFDIEKRLEKFVPVMKKLQEQTGVKLLWGTANLFSNPRYMNGAATNPDFAVLTNVSVQLKNAIDATIFLGGENYVFWGGREGTETDSGKNPLEASKRTREVMNFLCEYALDKKYDLRFALEAKPNEPRGDIYNPTTGHMLAFINTLDHPEMVGVNPEVAHEHMAGINFMHGVAQAWEAGKLFHIDLNDQYPGRYDQDLRFGSRDIKAAFYLVKFLEDVGYSGSRHFDAHAYRTEDYQGVKDFARGCMRTYLILKEKAAQFNHDPEIQALLEEINTDDGLMAPYFGKYSPEKAAALKAQTFDRPAIASRGLKYERLDQLTIEILLGVR